MNFCVFYKFARCILVFFDKLQTACDRKGIAMSALLDKIDMSRGNIARWKSGLEPKAATKQKLAEALGIEREELEEREKPAPENRNGLSIKEQKDIARKLEKMMAELEESGDLMFDGDPASEEAKESIRNALAMGLEYARKVNREKYNPYKNKKKKD